MRITIVIFLGAVAALADPAPLLAKTPEPPKTGDQASPPACYGYEQQQDGTWKQTPCQERGSNAEGDEKSSKRNAEKASH